MTAHSQPPKRLIDNAEAFVDVADIRYPAPWVNVNADGGVTMATPVAERVAAALPERLCSICGQGLGRGGEVWLIAPRVDRATGTLSSREPAVHIACGTWALQVCPFLFQGVNREVAGHRDLAIALVALREPLLRCSESVGVMPVLTASIREARLSFWVKGKRIASNVELETVAGGHLAVASD